MPTDRDEAELLFEWYCWWFASPEAPSKMPEALHIRTALVLQDMGYDISCIATERDWPVTEVGQGVDLPLREDGPIPDLFQKVEVEGGEHDPTERTISS